ncbi:septation protein SepH [soil metagenome]
MHRGADETGAVRTAHAEGGAGKADTMRDLRLVGLSEDRRHVVLRSDTDEEFRVPADDSLRAAARGDRARPGQLETKMDSALRPRDIQARIRAGASPEEVADIAAAPVDKIMGYAVPVLAEREHIAERARAATLRRKHTEGPTRLLGDVVAAQLRSRGHDPVVAAWDSWRRDDGRWMVTVSPAGSDETGRYVFDVPGRYVVADDDVARALGADEPGVDDPSDMAIASAVAEGGGASTFVDSDRLDDEHEPPRQRPDSGPGEDHIGSPDEPTPFGGAVSRLRRRRPLHQVPDPLPLDDADQPGSTLEADPSADPSADAEPGSNRTPPSEPRRRRARGRASVPSWDEIMFGGGKQER